MSSISRTLAAGSTAALMTAGCAAADIQPELNGFMPPQSPVPIDFTETPATEEEKEHIADEYYPYFDLGVLAACNGVELQGLIPIDETFNVDYPFSGELEIIKPSFNGPNISQQRELWEYITYQIISADDNPGGLESGLIVASMFRGQRAVQTDPSTCEKPLVA